LDDWYRVSLSQIQRWANLATSSKLAALLKISYPHHQWNEDLLSNGNMKASQREVMLAIHQLFPTHSKTNVFFDFEQKLKKISNILT